MNLLKIFVIFSLIVFIFTPQSNSQLAKDNVTIRGEVIEVCSSMGMMNMGMMNMGMMNMGMMNMGKNEEHKNAPITSMMGPLGILTTDGILYCPIVMPDKDMMNMDMMNMMGKDEEHKNTPMPNLKDYIGQKVEVTGTLFSHCMMNGIKIDTINKVQ